MNNVFQPSIEVTLNFTTNYKYSKKKTREKPDRVIKKEPMELLYLLTK